MKLQSSALCFPTRTRVLYKERDLGCKKGKPNTGLYLVFTLSLLQDRHKH